VDALDPLAATLARFLARELRSLRRELEAYPDDASLWALPPGLPNAGGTLALHLAGNLRHYVGAVLGGTGYVRDRPAEFAARGVPLAAVLAEVDAATADVQATLPRLTAEDMARPYPEPIRDVDLETGTFLLQLLVHLGYHLGQLSYHRRLVTGDARGVDALNPADLDSAL